MITFVKKWTESSLILKIIIGLIIGAILGLFCYYSNWCGKIRVNSSRIASFF